MTILRISKVTTFLVGIMVITILLCCSRKIKAAQEGDYTYTLTSSGKAQITKYTGSGGVVTIPSTLGGAPVTTIGTAAFRNCTSLINVTIPQGVTWIIGPYAFANCGNLTSLSIPQGVLSVGGIGNLAFEGCVGLTTITFKSAKTYNISCQIQLNLQQRL